MLKPIKRFEIKKNFCIFVCLKQKYERRIRIKTNKILSKIF